MTMNELREKLNSLSEQNYAGFLKSFGGGLRDREAVVSEFASHPEFERRLCQLLQLPTEDERRTGASVDTAKSSRRSATVAVVSAAVALLSMFMSYMNSRESSASATAAFSLAENALTSVREAGRLEQRAWVTAETAQLVRPPALGERPSAILRILNTGRTPATRLASAGTVISRPVLSPEDLDGEEVGLPTSNATLGPSVSMLIYPSSSHPFTNEEQIKALRAGRNTLYVIGTIYYYDVFGKEHQTRYCFSGSGDDLFRQVRGLAACAEHNDVN